MTLFQILAAFFGMWMMYQVYIYAKKKIFTNVELGLWLSIWCLFILISLFPNLLMGIAQTLKFNRVFDLLVVLSLIILTVTIFMSYFTQKVNSQRLQDLVQELAIKNATPPKTHKKVTGEK